MLPYILFIALCFNVHQPTVAPNLTGAWETVLTDGSKGLWIIADDHFSITYYQLKPAAFISTRGGKISSTTDNLIMNFEFNTGNKNLVGQQKTLPFKMKNNKFLVDGAVWKRVDDGTPGKLSGAWLITGRRHNGKMNTHTPGPRKTMKILSGTRFQWIAYNSETAEFFGTGGGSYTTENGKYTENIEFFSRDNSRVGASLTFAYELKDGHWHHSGHSSKGDPLYEIWSRR